MRVLTQTLKPNLFEIFAARLEVGPWHKALIRDWWGPQFVFAVFFSSKKFYQQPSSLILCA